MEWVKFLGACGEVVAKRTSYEDLETEIPEVDVLVVRVGTKVDRNILDRAKRLKIIASMTTGLDHIDVGHAKSMGIKMISLPGYATTATAEYTMTMILSLSRKLPWAFEHAKREKWERHRFLGTELHGKTLGVIGMGRIGSRVAGYASSFGMRIVFFDPYVDINMLKGMEAEQVGTVDELMEKSDVVTIHTFLSKETERLINSERMSKMKRGSIIVNASRGLVIDESDLIDALESGKVAGAALDVFEEEPLPLSHRIVEYARSHENLIITPHIAGSTVESIESAASFVSKSIKEALSDK